MESQTNNQIAKASNKRKYLVIAGIVKAIICIAAIVVWAKYASPSPSAYAVIIAVVVASLLIFDVFMVAIAQDRRISLNTKDALFVNFVTMTLLGFTLCCILVFDAMTCNGGASGGFCSKVSLVLIPVILIGASILYIIVSLLTILIIRIVSKRY